MSNDRRSFLRGALGGVAAGAALNLLPATVRKAMAIPANNATGTIMDVEHVVIFMQENRAFDHYLGALNGVRGFGDPRPQRLPGGASVWRQPSAEHPDGFVAPFHGDSRTTNAYTVDGADQGHSGDHHRQRRPLRSVGPFGRAAQADGLLQGLRPALLPRPGRRLHRLRRLPLLDPDPDLSEPPAPLDRLQRRRKSRRRSGDEQLRRGRDAQRRHGRGQADGPRPHEWTTYAERLQAAGVSWKVYQEYDNFGDNILSVFKPFRPCPRTRPSISVAAPGCPEDKTGADRTRSDGEQLVEAFRADIAAGACRRCRGSSRRPTCPNIHRPSRPRASMSAPS
jgi:phospholipase C